MPKKAHAATPLADYPDGIADGSLGVLADYLRGKGGTVHDVLHHAWHAQGYFMGQYDDHANPFAQPPAGAAGVDDKGQPREPDSPRPLAEDDPHRPRDQDPAENQGRPRSAGPVRPAPAASPMSGARKAVNAMSNEDMAQFCDRVDGNLKESGSVGDAGVLRASGSAGFFTILAIIGKVIDMVTAGR